MDVYVAFDLWPRKQVRRHVPGQLIACRVGVSRSARAKIHHLRALLAGAMHQREADTPQAGVPRFVSSKREGGCHCGIDRIAAGVQHRDACLGRALRLRYNHAAATLRRWFAELPILRDVWRRDVGHWSGVLLLRCDAPMLEGALQVRGRIRRRANSRSPAACTPGPLPLILPRAWSNVARTTRDRRCT